MDFDAKILHLLVLLKDILEPSEFVLDYKNHVASRVSSTGFNKIFFDIIKVSENQISVLCNFWVRDNQIQNIRGKIVPKRAKLDKPTIIINTKHLLSLLNKNELDFESNNGHLINLQSSSQINSWLDKILSFMKSAGLPFFSSFNNVKDFDRWFNEPVISGTYNFKTGLLWNDSISGLVAAKLSNNPNYQVIYDTWHYEISQINDSKTLIELEHMHAYLQKQ